MHIIGSEIPGRQSDSSQKGALTSCKEQAPGQQNPLHLNRDPGCSRKRSQPDRISRRLALDLPADSLNLTLGRGSGSGGAGGGWVPRVSAPERASACKTPRPSGCFSPAPPGTPRPPGFCAQRANPRPAAQRQPSSRTCRLQAQPHWPWPAGAGPVVHSLAASANAGPIFV